MTSSEKLFHEKLSILNENFVRFMQNSRKETPFADFTPTVHDYLKHVAELDKIYGAPLVENRETLKRASALVADGAPASKHTKSTGFAFDLSSGSSSANFKALLSNSGAEKSSKESVLSNLGAEKSTNESVLSNSGAEKSTQPLFFGAKLTSKPEASSAKESDKGSPTVTTTFSLLPTTTTSSTLAKPGFLFGSSKLAFPSTTFSLNSPEKSNGTTDGAPAAKQTKPTGFAFDLSSSSSVKTLLSNSGTDKTTKEAQPLFFGAKVTSIPEASSAKESDKGSPTVTTTFSLLPTTTTSSTLAKPGFLFGSSKLTFPSTTFSLNPSEKWNGTTENDNEDEPQEPPKPEEIEQIEKDAIFSYKCVVYTLEEKNYSKKGVAYVSIKKLDEGDGVRKQLLIREATSIGRLWTNTLVNDTLKWQKMDDKKLRISHPNKTATNEAGSGAITILLRFGTPSELSTLVKEFESAESSA